MIGTDVEVFEAVEAEILDPAMPVRAARPRANLSDTARRRLQKSVPAETQRAYNREWKRFTEWCAAAGENPLPCTTDTLTNWVADRADEGNGLSAIRQGIGAVVLRHEATYGDGSKLVPVTKDAWRVVYQYKKELVDGGWKANKAATVNPDEFRRMVATIPDDTPAGVRDRSILATTLGAFFRRSNTMLLNVEDVDEVLAEMQAATEDAEVEEETNIHLFASRSKTDQVGRGRTVVLIPGEHELSDPVGLLLAWVCELKVQGITTGPLYRPIHRSGRILDRRLNADHVRLLVRDSAKAAGVTNSRGRTYKSHSLRASGVTISRRAGKSWAVIREQGDWAEGSPVVMGYDRPEAEEHALRGTGL
jgi:hypothetical protein